jgi:uncharacterized membrane protein (UPF0127 family)
MTFDARALRRLLVVAVVLGLLGVYVFVLRGADQPSDPELGPPVGSTVVGATAPGDPNRVPIGDFAELAISVQPGDGGEPLLWCLLAALNAQQRSRGLMEVTDLQGYSGMIFVYDADSTGSYYMRNVPRPLSIAWIDAAGQIVSTTDMAPCEDREGCPTYAPGGPYRYAIETFEGDLDDLGITEGATVSIAGACAARA